MIDWAALIKELVAEYGLYGVGVSIIVWLLIKVVKYQETKYLQAEKEHRADWDLVHKRHREDRNDWIADMRTIQSSCLVKLENIQENSNDAINANTEALTVLKVHIEKCDKS